MRPMSWLTAEDACSHLARLSLSSQYHNLSLGNRGVAKPEFKFFCMLYTVWIPPIGLMIYGIVTYYGIHWIFADLGIVIFCFGISIAVVAIQSYIVDCYALLAGSALTATIVFRSIVGTGATIVRCHASGQHQAKRDRLTAFSYRAAKICCCTPACCGAT